MKKLRISVLMVFIMLAVGVIVACGAPELDRPSDLKLVNKTLTWSAVDNARGYVVQINGEQYNTYTTSYSFDNLVLAEGKYTIKVKARSGGVNYADSAWASVTYIQGYESGIRYELAGDGTEYKAVGIGRASGDIVIDDFYNGLPVTSIGSFAFNNALGVTSVTMGKNVKTIEERAFFGCALMTDLDLNIGLESIGKMAFQSCTVLKDIVIPDSVRTIEQSAFAYCRGAVGLDLGIGVTAIGEKAFDTCQSLESVTLPTSLLQVGENAFTACSSLKSVNILSCDATFDGDTFTDCDALTDIDFGPDVTTVARRMFSACDALETVSFTGTDVERISDGAFAGCTKLSAVSIGDVVKEIGRNVFSLTALYNAFIESGDKIFVVDKWVVGKRDTVGTADINALSGIDGVCAYAFYNSNELTTLTLPASVKYVGTYAFGECRALTAVGFGANLREVGYAAFANCTELIYLLINDKLQVIDSYAFSGCGKLAESGVYTLVGGSSRALGLPGGLTRIGTYAFRGTALWNDQLLSDPPDKPAAESGNGVIYLGKWVIGCDTDSSGIIDIKRETTALSDYAFAYCKLITEIVLPSTVTNIGAGAFYNCTGGDDSNPLAAMSNCLTVNIPGGVTEIKERTFMGSGLKTVVIPESVVEIGSSAFSESALTSVEIPATVKRFGTGIFQNCSSLKAATLAEGMESIAPSMFNSCTGLKSIVIPSSVKSISDNAFFHCDALESVDLPDGVTTIGEYAFYMCGALRELELPSGLTDIRAYAFYKCTGLGEVRFGDDLEHIGKAAFYGCDALETIVLPKGPVRIDDKAFMLCPILQSVAIYGNVAAIGDHAFYGCRIASFYCEAETVPESWSLLWNSMYRPAIFGCKFDEDGNLVSFVKDKGKVYNYNAVYGIYPPRKDGYKFVGWARDRDAAAPDYKFGWIEPDIDGMPYYADNDVMSAPDGTTLYAVWKSKTDNVAQSAKL